MSCGIEASFLELMVISPGFASALPYWYASAPEATVGMSSVPPCSCATLVVLGLARLGQAAGVLPARAGGRRHVCGDVLGVLALDEVGGHAGQLLAGLRVELRHPVGVQDLAVDDALDRGALEALVERLLEGLVEVRAADALGPGAGQRVARRALLHEQRLAVDQVVAVVLELAAGERHRGDDQEQRDPDPSSTHGAASYLSAGRREPCAEPARIRAAGGRRGGPRRPRRPSWRRRPTSSARAPRRRSARASPTAAPPAPRASSRGPRPAA